MCQTADNASVNKKVARLLGIPHIPCNNHLFNSEVQYMVTHNNGLKAVLDSIHGTMAAVKGSLESSAVLRLLTWLKPEIGNETHWTGWGMMLRKYVRIRLLLLEASENDDANFPMDARQVFRRRAEKQALMFEDINSIAISMQHKMYTLSACRKDLNEIITESESLQLNLDSHWYQNRFGKLYISSNSFKLPDPYFVSGIIKIQDDETESLTFEEKLACEKLLTGEIVVHGDVLPQATTLAQRIKLQNKKRKAGELDRKMSLYKDVGFICGSAAEVERIWSICKYILTNLRSKLTPVFFEALVYLKINADYWELKTVQDAYTDVLRDTRNERLQKRIDEDQGYLENEEP